MYLTGQSRQATRSETILGWLGLAIGLILLLPWITIAVGCVLVGVGSLFRGDYSLIACIPAGLALLILPSLLYYLERRWYPTISALTLDGNIITYRIDGDHGVRTQESGQVRWVEHRMSKAGKTRGYRVKFRDGSGLYFCRSFPNADEFARVFKEFSRSAI